MSLADRLLASHPVIELFAGPGGWAEGVAPLGLAPRGIDNNVDACDTGRAAGHYRHLANVAATDPRSVLQPWGQPVGMLASPPCPGFSHGGLKRGLTDAERVLGALRARVSDVGDLDRIIDELDVHMTDARTLLALEPLRWALTLGPRWLAWEQVPYVAPLWHECARILERYGYSTAVGILHAEAYGVPQVRKRAVLVARDAGATEAFGPVALPVPTYSRFHARQPERRDPDWLEPERLLPAPRTMAEALGWGMTARPYPAIAPGTARGGQDPMMLGGSGAREAVRREYEAGRWQTTPDRPAGLPWDLGTRRRLRLTPAEAGVLQGFSPGYPWQGRPTSQYRQIGDAVPVQLARRIVQAVAA